MTTVTIDAPVDLVIHGTATEGSPSLVRGGLQVPQPGVVLEYAPSGRFTTGDSPVASRTPNTAIGLRVRVVSADEAAHLTAVAALRTAVSQFTYTTTITQDATSTVWASYAGQVVAVPDTRIRIEAGPIREEFTITIPVHPVAVP